MNTRIWTVTIQYNPFWEANSRLDGKEIPRLHYRQPQLRILSHINPIHTPEIYLF
jgi:hypothetical protein